MFLVKEVRRYYEDEMWVRVSERESEKGQKVKSCFLQNAGALIDPPPITALITLLSKYFHKLKSAPGIWVKIIYWHLFY